MFDYIWNEKKLYRIWEKETADNWFEIHMVRDFSLEWCPISRVYCIYVFIGKLSILLYTVNSGIGNGLIWINGVNRQNERRMETCSMHAEQQMSFVAWLTVLSDKFDLNSPGSKKCIAIHAIDMFAVTVCIRASRGVHTSHINQCD